MTLSGRLAHGQKTLYSKSVSDDCGESAGFRDRLENCLLRLCKDADIPVPMWVSKNTNEIRQMGRTVFYADQFAEQVSFERFEIRIVNA